MGVADNNALATIGRGPTLAIAREAALKLNEGNVQPARRGFQRRGTDRLSA
jgi:fructoselysine-6-P-deglycase FrlB-like protein